MTTEQIIKQVLGQSAQQFLFYAKHKSGCTYLTGEGCKCGLSVVANAIERQWGINNSTNTYTPADMPGTHNTVYICAECDYVNNEHLHTCSLYTGDQPIDVKAVVSENEQLVARVSELQNQTTELDQQLTDATESVDKLQVDRQVREEVAGNIVNSRFGFVDVPT